MSRTRSASATAAPCARSCGIPCCRGLPRAETLRGGVVAHDVAATDAEAFAGRALELLLDLHEGALLRYRLRPDHPFEARRTRYTLRDAHG